MEFPFGHHPHSRVRDHQHRREEDEEDDYDERRNYPPPPPPGSFPDPAAYPPARDDLRPPPPPSFSSFPHRPSYDYPSEQPPPPVVAYSNEDYSPSDANHGHRRPADDYVATGGRISDDYPPSETSHGYRRPTDEYGAAGGRIISHDSGESEAHHGYHPHLPSFLQHHAHQSASTLSNKPTYKIITKANPDYALTIRDGHVILAQSDPSDDAQHWYKDEKYSTRVKDEEGFPCFALVNKATGQAMKHSVGASHPVNLVAYNSEVLDESVLWTQGKDLGDGYKTVRMINNIRLLVDAYHGDKKSGGIRDGTTIVLWQWNKGDNQQWKIIPYCKFLNPSGKFLEEHASRILKLFVDLS